MVKIRPGETLTEMRTVDCRDCGKSFEYEHCSAFETSREFCDGCAAKSAETWQRGRQTSIRALNATVAKQIVPAEMRTAEIGGDSDPSRFPSDAWQASQDWTSGNLGIVGPSGRCKTRMLYAVLTRWMLDSPKKLDLSAADAVTMAEFKMLAASRFDDRERYYRIRCCSVLILDDVDKVSLTEDGASALFNVVDFRKTRRKPILWSSNASDSAALIAAMSAKLDATTRDAAIVPIVRRLVEGIIAST